MLPKRSFHSRRHSFTSFTSWLANADAAPELSLTLTHHTIDVEKQWSAQQLPVQTVKLPQTYVEALRALADTAEEAQQLKLVNLAANQVIGETRAQLVNTEIKLETAEDHIEILLNKIELPKVSILIEEFCHLYGNLLGVTEVNLFRLLYRHKILRETDRGGTTFDGLVGHVRESILPGIGAMLHPTQCPRCLVSLKLGLSNNAFDLVFGDSVLFNQG